jgi:hypothetical protein
MANVNTDLVANFVAVPQVLNSAKPITWRKKSCYWNNSVSCW